MWRRSAARPRTAASGCRATIRAALFALVKAEGLAHTQVVVEGDDLGGSDLAASDVTASDWGATPHRMRHGARPVEEDDGTLYGDQPIPSAADDGY